MRAARFDVKRGAHAPGCELRHARSTPSAGFPIEGYGHRESTGARAGYAPRPTVVATANPSSAYPHQRNCGAGKPKMMPIGPNAPAATSTASAVRGRRADLSRPSSSATTMMFAPASAIQRA